VSAPTKKPGLREARFEDCEGVLALMRRNGLPVESTTGRWRWLWQENPAAESVQAQWPMGWVLEGENEIVGYLGNVPLLYHFNGGLLRAAAARGFAVDTSARSHSLRLVAAHFSQTGADLFLNTSANAAAASVWGLCKAHTIPQSQYDKVLVWVLNERAFVESYLRKIGKAPWLASLGGYFLAPLAAAEGLVRRRAPKSRSQGSTVSSLNPERINDEFDALWASVLRAHPDRLLADRSAAALRWHFSRSSAVERRAKVLTVNRNGVLAGYAVVTREDSERLGLKRLRVSDLLAKDDEPSVIDDLLVAAHESAASDGCHVLEMVGFPAPIRERAIAGNPLAYTLPAPPYWYKARDASVAAALTREPRWYGSPYDGDSTL